MADSGCGEGCRTYVNEAAGKTILTVIVAALILAIIYSVCILFLGMNDLPGSEQIEMAADIIIPAGVIPATGYAGSSLSVADGQMVFMTGVCLSGYSIENGNFSVTNYGPDSQDITGWSVKDELNNYLYTYPEIILEKGKTVTVYEGSPISRTYLDESGVLVIWTTDEFSENIGQVAILCNAEGKAVDAAVDA